MKYSFDLARHRKANVWLDEAPSANFTALYSTKRTLKVTKTANAARRIAAVEISVARGPMYSYAFLGAELAALDLDGLEVVLPINGIGPAYASSIASPQDEIRLGLPEEYVESVMVGIQTAGDLIGLPTCASLQFRWAAHAQIGSSRSIFKTTSSLIIQLLMLPKEDLEKQIVALFG